MKLTPSGARTRASLLACASLCATVTVHAQSGVWTGTTSAELWSNTANWSGGTIADGAGNNADFSALDLPEGLGRTEPVGFLSPFWIIADPIGRVRNHQMGLLALEHRSHVLGVGAVAA